MTARKRTVRAMLAASLMIAFATSASAMGMGGGGIGGMGVGMAGAGAPGALGFAATASINNYSTATGGANGGHIPVGAMDGPSGMSATFGHNPFGDASASAAWTSLPALDPDLPGMTVPTAH